MGQDREVQGRLRKLNVLTTLLLLQHPGPRTRYNVPAPLSQYVTDRICR